MKKLVLLFLFISSLRHAHAVSDEQFNELLERVNALSQTVGPRLDHAMVRIENLRNEINSAVPIGTILPYGGNGVVHEDYLLCDGRWVNNADYPLLHGLIATVFSSEKEREEHPNQFRLPDLRGRTLVGEHVPDQGNPARGADRKTFAECLLGSSRGSECAFLKNENLPPHTHSGTSLPENESHTHTGTTTNDGVHSHGFKTAAHGVGINGGRIASACDSGLSEILPGINGISGDGVHNHNLIIDPAKTTHTHQFTTSVENEGKIHGRVSSAVSLLNPATIVRFMIRSR